MIAAGSNRREGEENIQSMFVLAASSNAMTKPSKKDSGAKITPKEMKELRRVYDQLCFFSEKAPRLVRLNAIRTQLAEIQRPESSHDIIRTSCPRGIGDTTQPEIQSKVVELNKEKDALQNEMNEILSRPDQVIRPKDTGTAMKHLGKRMTKKEIHDMMWEVDEKLDGVIDWEEFQIMFERNVRDTSGLEPNSFYHMVQFMIYDHDGNGMVSIDETMNMLYARLGRAKMEAAISKLFGGDDGGPIKEVGQQGGEIDFQRYWSVVEKDQLKMFHESELGRTLAEKKKKRTGQQVLSRSEAPSR